MSLSWCIHAQAPPPVTNLAPTNSLRLDLAHREFIKENASALTFGLDQIEQLQRPILGHPLWRYVASAIYVFLAFFVAKVVDWIINSQLRRWAARTATQWDDVVIGLFDGPVKIVAFVVLLNIGLQLFDWPVWVETWLSRATVLAVGLSIVLVILKAVDALVLLWKQRLAPGGDRTFNESFVTLVGKVVKAGIVVVTAFTVLGNLGFDIRAALASVSVAGLALGLAAQDTVGNLFGAVAVFVDKPFRLGDRVKIGDVEGTVEDMGLRATRIRSLDGFLVTVPNKNVGNATVVNITNRPTIKTTMVLGLTYDTSAENVRKAVELLELILREHPETHDCVVHFSSLAASSLNIEAVHWSKETEPRKFTRILQDLNLAIKRRFDEAGLEFAFPTQTLFVRGEQGSSPPAPNVGPTTR